MKALVLVFIIATTAASTAETMTVRDHIIRENSPATLAITGLTVGEEYSVNWTNKAVGESFVATETAKDLVLNIRGDKTTTSITIYLYNSTALVYDLSVAYQPASNEQLGDIIETYVPAAATLIIAFCLFGVPIMYLRRGRN